MHKLGVTGHRPGKLWGYNYDNVHYINMSEYFKDYIINEKVTDVYCGMALGVDMIMALVVLDLRDMGYDVKLHACIPCMNQDCKWNLYDRNQYMKVLELADEILGVEEDGSVQVLKFVPIDNIHYILVKEDGSIYEQEYRTYLMQERNKIIVDNIHTLIAVWDGSSGGTRNCIAYANSVGKVNIIKKCPGEF